MCFVIYILQSRFEFYFKMHHGYSSKTVVKTCKDGLGTTQNVNVEFCYTNGLKNDISKQLLTSVPVDVRIYQPCSLGEYHFSSR